jgi:hypothetical protein
MKTKCFLFVFALVLFNSSFAQTWKGSGISVVKNGNSATVKWTNGSGGVTTKNATCNGWRDVGFFPGMLSKTICTCTSGRFVITKDEVMQSIDIDYFNSLDTYLWSFKKVHKQ